MELEEIMKKYSQDIKIKTDEEEILNTIYKCKEVFYQKEQEKMLSYLEFLYTQFKTINKRWWLLQFFLLTAAEIVFNISNEEYYIRRGLGITGVLFVVLVIPELWKNRTCGCMEIEASSFYFLKKFMQHVFFCLELQIYSCLLFFAISCIKIYILQLWNLWYNFCFQ